MGINLDNAIKAPADGRTKLRAAVTRHEQLYAETISQHNCCGMSKWLHRAGTSKFGGKPTFVELIDAHLTFHFEARTALHRERRDARQLPHSSEQPRLNPARHNTCRLYRTKNRGWR